MLLKKIINFEAFVYVIETNPSVERLIKKKSDVVFSHVCFKIKSVKAVRWFIQRYHISKEVVVRYNYDIIYRLMDEELWDVLFCLIDEYGITKAEFMLETIDKIMFRTKYGVVATLLQKLDIREEDVIDNPIYPRIRKVPGYKAYFGWKD
jgi:hypothetical protein